MTKDNLDVTEAVARLDEITASLSDQVDSLFAEGLRVAGTLVSQASASIELAKEQIEAAMQSAREPNPVVIDLRVGFFGQLEEAAAASNWIPPEYMANDWVADCAEYLRNGGPKPASPPTGDVVEALRVLRNAVAETLDKDFGFWSSPSQAERRTMLYRAWKDSAALATLQPADPVEPKVSSDVAMVVARCERVIANFRETTDFPRGDFNLDDIATLLATLRASEPSRELVEKAFREGYRRGQQNGTRENADGEWSQARAALAQGQAR